MDTSGIGKVVNPWGAPTLDGLDLNNLQEGQRVRGSARQYVRFYSKKVPRVKATKAQINPLTGSAKVLETMVDEVEREFVEIITPGDKNTVDDFAEEFHKREHWKEYQAFRAGKTAPLGKPVEDCEYISPPQATELRIHHCHTEEQLADASDILVNQIPNGWTLREFARAMCKARRDNKDLNKVNALQAELSRTQADLAELKRLFTGSSESVVTEEIKKRGRPKKVHTGLENDQNTNQES